MEGGDEEAEMLIWSEVSCGFVYKFVFIEDPGEEVAKHLAFLKGRDVHGRIYINEQGINAQYCGPVADAMAYVEWLKEYNRLSDVIVQMSPAFNGHAFPRLKLQMEELHTFLFPLDLLSGQSKYFASLVSMVHSDVINLTLIGSCCYWMLGMVMRGTLVALMVLNDPMWTVLGLRLLD